MSPPADTRLAEPPEELPPSQVEQEEEFITMKLMKRLADLKTEKETLANEVRSPRTRLPPAASHPACRSKRQCGPCRWSRRRSS